MPRMTDRLDDSAARMHITSLRAALDDEVEQTLRHNLATCTDLAFAHIVEVLVPDHQEGSSRVLFAWLRPEGLRSIRAALNLVSAAVSSSLPEDEFLDVVILNSAPELLTEVEQHGLLLAENDPAERAAALEAAYNAEHLAPEPEPDRPWWKIW